MLIAVSYEVQSNVSRQPLEQLLDVFILPTVALRAVPPRPVNAGIKYLSIMILVVTNLKKPPSLPDIDASTTGQIQAFKLRAGIQYGEKTVPYVI